MKKGTLLYYLVATSLFLLFKFAHTFADNENLLFLLAPTNTLLGILTNSHGTFLKDVGYYHETLNILIDKSCSGFNFGIICFLCFTHLGVKHFASDWQKLLTLPSSLVTAYLLTIASNTSRIFVSIHVQGYTATAIGHPEVVHEVIGVIIHLSYLIFAYYAIEKLLNEKLPIEKHPHEHIA